MGWAVAKTLGVKRPAVEGEFAVDALLGELGSYATAGRSMGGRAGNWGGGALMLPLSAARGPVVLLPEMLSLRARFPFTLVWSW